MFPEKNRIMNLYKNDMVDILKMIYPTLNRDVIENAVEESARKRYKKENVVLNNNYTKTTQDSTLIALTNYILEKEPIMTAYGVLFQKHADSENPLIDMIAMFMNNRGIHKKEMFKYPKGSELFEKYNLLQSLDKVDCNAIYGILSAASSALYNIYVAGSITAQGRSLISSATMFFEMFLANNVKFASLDEVLVFVNNVKKEKPRRQFDDRQILDRDILPEECFAKLVLTTGDYRHGRIKWIPSEYDLDIIWSAVNHLSQEDINRVYYKNNLYDFFDNKSMTNALVYIMKKMKQPYLDPNTVPEEISVELESLLELVKEYVFYNYQIIDRIERNAEMVKNVAVISDTDSAIVSLDAWYHYVLEKVEGIYLQINDEQIKEIVEYTFNTKWKPEIVGTTYDFDFKTNEIKEIPKQKDIVTFVVNNKLKFSIINIMAFMCSRLINDYMIAYTKSNHSYAEGKECLIIMKNEFTFGTAMLTNQKKHYASIQQVQEGNMINDGVGMMDIKGLEMNKNTVNDKAKQELKDILYDEVLMPEEINQINIIKKLAIMEKRIYDSLHSGEKEYYKPASIKSLNSYDDPMRIQGVKAAVIWNTVREPELAAIDLETRNTVGIVKVNITEDNIEKIKDTHPGVYERFVALFNDESIIRTPKDENWSSKKTKKSITSIAVPVDVKTPSWLFEFIDYTSIINDVVKLFPIESVNIRTLNNNNVNYTNIMKI